MNPQDIARAVLREKLIAISTYIKKKKVSGSRSDDTLEHLGKKKIPNKQKMRNKKNRNRNK